MDKLSGLASKLGGKSGSNSNSNSGSNSGSNSEDYLDKGLDSVERKFGVKDTNKARSINEKITDTTREQFEKATGKKVPAKFSN